MDPILKFDADWNVVESFGGGMFIWPHGLFVNEDRNVWMTDAVRPDLTPAGIKV